MLLKKFQIKVINKFGFVKAIINYVRENGDITKEDLLEKAPFDNYSIVTLFGEDLPKVLNMVNILHDSVNVA